MQRLKHPNIVQVFGFYSGTDGQADVHFMAMELLEGRDLFDTVNADGPLPCRAAADFIRQAVLGLEYAHQAGDLCIGISSQGLFFCLLIKPSEFSWDLGWLRMSEAKKA